VAAGYDATDPYSRPDADDVDLAMPTPPDEFRFGVPAADELAFFGDADAPDLFERAIDRLESIGGTAVEVGFGPFRDAAELLYEGPWVAERLSVVQDLLETNPDALLPVIRQIVARGAAYSAVDTFDAMYELKRLRRSASAELQGVDCLVTPTVGPAYRIDEVQAEPVDRNSDLGYYTNYVNLLDLAAVAVPAGFRESGIPFGITLLGEADDDAFLSALADAFHQETSPPGVSEAASE
jgi:allophanate hydrolase